MALVTTLPADQSRAYSVGPLKIQLMNFSVASGDTSAVITPPDLHSIAYYMIHGVGETAPGVISGNTLTLAFADPLATRYGQVMIYGR